MMSEPAMLEVEGIETFYGASQALHGVDLQVRAGEAVALMGRNGMGKSTTIRSICRLTPHRRGRIRFEALPEDAERVPGRERSPEQVISEETFDPVLQTALANLSPEYRAAVVLSDIEDLSYEEVGRILGVKMGTVRSRIHRGRAALRAELEAAGVTGAHQRID